MFKGKKTKEKVVTSYTKSDVPLKIKLKILAMSHSTFLLSNTQWLLNRFVLQGILFLYSKV